MIDLRSIVSQSVCTPFSWSEDDSDTGSRLGGQPPEGIQPPEGEDPRYVMTLALTDDVELTMFAMRERMPDYLTEPLSAGKDAYYARAESQTIITGDEVLSFLLHGPSRRATDSPFVSGLEPRRIELWKPIADTMANRYAFKEGMRGPFARSPHSGELPPGVTKQLPFVSDDPADFRAPDGATLVFYPQATRTVVGEMFPAEANKPATDSKIGGRPSFFDDGDIDENYNLELHTDLIQQGYTFLIQFESAYSGGSWPGEWPLYDVGETYVYFRDARGEYEWAYFWAE